MDDETIAAYFCTFVFGAFLTWFGYRIYTDNLHPSKYAQQADWHVGIAPSGNGFQEGDEDDEHPSHEHLMKEYLAALRAQGGK
jgi:hypothetical protein